MLEQFDYRSSLQAFFTATVADPDLRYRYELDASSVVLDIGGYRGEWAVRVSELYGSRIHVFEPNPVVWDRLRNKVSKHPNITAWPFGLGGADAMVRLTLAGPGSAIADARSNGPTASVPIRDGVAVIEELGLDRIDLCKMNIEGGEYDLLDRFIETEWIQRISQLQIQFHEWARGAHRRRRRIRRRLRSTHDEQWNYEWVFESWRRSASGSR